MICSNCIKNDVCPFQDDCRLGEEKLIKENQQDPRFNRVLTCKYRVDKSVTSNLFNQSGFGSNIRK